MCCVCIIVGKCKRYQTAIVISAVYKASVKGVKEYDAVQLGQGGSIIIVRIHHIINKQYSTKIASYINQIRRPRATSS
jgi:hypothetical protein